MATLHVRENFVLGNFNALVKGQIPFDGFRIQLPFPVSIQALAQLKMSMLFPLRIVAGIHWGQGKEAAELDCQRRLREMGR